MIKRILTGYNAQQQGARGAASIQIPTNIEIEAAVASFKKATWFTTWDSINLLRQIEKKKWKRTYA